MARYIFVTGGVVSSLGKGLSSASLAYLLQSRGYKVRFITNGFMLTPRFIEKNPNLINVDHFRVSLFGYDEDQTISTTRNNKAFRVVKKNLTDYNKLNIDKPPLHINHVLLPTEFENLNNILNLKRTKISLQIILNILKK